MFAPDSAPFFKENNLAGTFAAPAFVLFPLESLSTISADYIDLPRCPDNGAAAGANIFDAAVNGFLASALGGAFHRQAAGIDLVLAQGFSDPCLRLRGQRRYRPAILGVLLDMQAVGLSGGLKFLIVVVSVVAYVLDAMNQIVEMGHLMQKRGCKLEDGPVKVLGAEIDWGIPASP